MKQQTTGHKLALNHSNALPRRIVAIDCESRREVCNDNGIIAKQTFRLGVVKSCRYANNKAVGVRTKRFSDAKELREYVYSHTNKRYTTWVIAHGLLADFRLAGFAHDIDAVIITPDSPRAKRQRECNDIDDPHTAGLVVLESPPTIIGVRCTDSDGRIVFVDTLNWFPIPLRDIGRSISIDKLDMPAWDAVDEDWFTYCERDTEILFAAFLRLMAFIREHDLGMFRYTAASQAISAFRHKYMPRQVYIHDNVMVKSWEREAYFGGRSEAFRYGQIAETCHYVDVNSLFPFIMQSLMVPYKLREYDENGVDPRVISQSTANMSLAECTVQTDRPCYPVRRDDFICYPIGKFSTALCGCELASAIRRGHVTSIRSIAVYDCDAIFELYVNSLWEMRRGYRQSGNATYSDFCKFLMNSLYGKFAQYAPRWQPVPERLDIDDWSQTAVVDWTTGEITEFRKFGKYTQQKMPKVERSDTFVAISAFVTAAARQHMDGLRAIAGHANTYYQGVDGLIVNDEGLGLLESAGEVSPYELGRLRIDYSGSPTEIYGIADYRLGGKVIMAGRPSMAVQLDDQTWLATLLSSKTDLFNGTVPVGMEEYQMKWKRNQQYRKGTFDQHGIWQPLVLDDQAGSGTTTSPSVALTNFAIASTTPSNSFGSPPFQASTACNTVRMDSSSVNPSARCSRSLF